MPPDTSGGTGSILRNKTAAILVILLWTLLAEWFFSGFLPSVPTIRRDPHGSRNGRRRHPRQPRFPRSSRNMGGCARPCSHPFHQARRHLTDGLAKGSRPLTLGPFRSLRAAILALAAATPALSSSPGALDLGKGAS